MCEYEIYIKKCINSIRQSGCNIRVWKFYNAKIEVVSFAKDSGTKIIIDVNLKININTLSI